MLTLTWPTPTMASQAKDGEQVLFGLLPQGGPTLSPQDAQALHALRAAILTRLTPPVCFTCHPHRVAQRCSVALHAEGQGGGSIDLLVTVSGQTRFPEEGEYARPRWYLTVPDATDLVYLVLYLNNLADRDNNVDPN
ncbi:hypothetical protein [Cedecea sp. NFIX57]|uniref:hypothetical protein n=1 Tax=Cedecea sp. NFIX57 TaxID=1566286 RepID=UPI000A0AC968|nr:hypothetical protein [Cedecea sp. NFIX57]SMG55114.1 hypothetical protein SAMN03159353_10185 [Cedecea sp. NFIX57]